MAKKIENVKNEKRNKIKYLENIKNRLKINKLVCYNIYIVPIVMPLLLTEENKVKPTIYPRVLVNYDFPYTSEPTHSKPIYEHSRGSPRFPMMRFETNRSRGSCVMIGQTTSKQRLQL